MTPQAGDVGLARGSSFVEWAIRFAESRRYGRKSLEASVNHAFLFDSPTTLIEAQGRGVVRSSTLEYAGRTIVLIRPVYPNGPQPAVDAMTGLLGRKYGYLEIVSEALAFMTGTRLRFGVEGQYICSGAVSHALERAGIDMGDDADWNSPADVYHQALQHGWQIEKVRM